MKNVPAAKKPRLAGRAEEDQWKSGSVDRDVFACFYGDVNKPVSRRSGARKRKMYGKSKKFVPWYQKSSS